MKKVLKQVGVAHAIKSIKTVVYIPIVHSIPKKEMHSRDITVSTDLILCATPACFNTFLIYHVPYSS